MLCSVTLGHVNDHWNVVNIQYSLMLQSLIGIDQHWQRRKGGANNNESSPFSQVVCVQLRTSLSSDELRAQFYLIPFHHIEDHGRGVSLENLQFHRNFKEGLNSGFSDRYVFTCIFTPKRNYRALNTFSWIKPASSLFPSCFLCQTFLSFSIWQTYWRTQICIVIEQPALVETSSLFNNTVTSCPDIWAQRNSRSVGKDGEAFPPFFIEGFIKTPCGGLKVFPVPRDFPSGYALLNDVQNRTVTFEQSPFTYIIKAHAGTVYTVSI